MPTALRTIAGVAIRLWVREVARALAAPTRRVVGLLAAAGAGALALGALLAVAASAGLPDAIPAELRAAVIGTSFGGATLTAGALGVALCAVAPPRTALQNLLGLLPVGPVPARLGQSLPTLLLGLGFTLALTSTSPVVLARTAPHPGSLAVGLVAYLALISAMLLAATALFSLVETAAVRAARMPASYATALAGAVTLAAVFAATLPDVLLPPPAPGTAPTPAGLLPHRAFAAAATAPSALASLTPLAWVGAAVGLTVLAARVHRPPGPPRRLVVPRGTRPLRASPAGGLLWAELLAAVRSPQTPLVAAVLPLAVAGVAVVARVPVAEPFLPSLATAVVLLPALLGLQAAGRSAPSEWSADLATARPAARLAPQAAAAALVAAPLAAAALGAFLALGLVAPETAGGLLLRGALALGLALACGAVIPWSEEQPVSASAAPLLLALVSLLLAVGVSAATAALGPHVEAPLVALAAVLAFGGYGAARLRGSDRIGAG